MSFHKYSDLIPAHPYYIAIDSVYMIFFSFPQGKEAAMFMFIDLLAGDSQPEHSREIFYM